MNIPSTLRAGDTITWDESIADYLATDGYTLAFLLYVYGKTPITITASADGAGYTVAVTAATSRSWTPGAYTYQAYVYKESGTSITEKYTVGTGSVTILPDLTDALSTTDYRSHVKKVLDALEALILGKTSSDYQAYTIAGRAITKMSPEELIKWRSVYLLEYQKEQEADGLKGENPRRIGVRFNRI